MTTLGWIDIDGVRYAWDGDDRIDCYGQFGYHTALGGHQLTQLEIENPEGDVAGVLEVDFASGAVHFTPTPGVDSHGITLLLGSEFGQSEVELASLSSEGWDDLLGVDEGLPDWTPTLIETAHAGAGQVLTWESFGLQESAGLLNEGHDGQGQSTLALSDLLIMEHAPIQLDLPPIVPDV